MRLVTIKDVAKRAGVSIAAVSYALNDKEGVNEDTKNRIRELAEEMGYVPNSLARGLLLRKTDVLGLAVPDISNPYMGHFIQCLDRYAGKEGYFLLLGSMSNSPGSETDMFKRLMSKKVDGFIVAPGHYDPELYRDIAAGLNRRGIPFLFANLSFPQIKSNYVVPDLEDGEYQITKYLLDEGFKDMAFVGGKREDYFSEIRYRGFKRALEESGLPNGGRLVECGSRYTFEEGYETALRQVGEGRLPEVFVAQNDSIAYGLIKGLRESGLKVPDDIGVVGFDDIEMPTVDTVPLTTVRIPLDEMARHCIDTLKKGADMKVLKQFILKTELVVRQSALRNSSGS